MGILKIFVDVFSPQIEFFGSNVQPWNQFSGSSSVHKPVQRFQFSGSSSCGSSSQTSSSGSASEGEEEEEEEGTYRSVNEYNGLCVGMELGGGQVCEIWPGIDKFTIEVRTRTGTEIKHHRISKSAATMLEQKLADIKMRPTLDKMD